MVPRGLIGCVAPTSPALTPRPTRSIPLPGGRDAPRLDIPPHQPERHALNPQSTPSDAQARDLLVTVVYASTATVEFTEVDLALLLASSRLQNRARGLSGLLLYRDRQFMQVLEGPSDEVSAVMGRIGADPRHGGMQILVRRPVAQRQFEGWSMAYKSLIDVDQGDVPVWFGSPAALRPQGGTEVGDLFDWFRED